MHPQPTPGPPPWIRLGVIHLTSLHATLCQRSLCWLRDRGCISGCFVVTRSSCRHGISMSSEPVCSLCCRRGGGCGGGAPINGLGCTGACLRWAVSNIKNPPFFEHGTPWQAWQLTTTIVACFRAICSDLNDLGCGCLHWSVVITPRDCRSMWAACLVALARMNLYVVCMKTVADSPLLSTPCFAMPQKMMLCRSAFLH